MYLLPELSLKIANFRQNKLILPLASFILEASFEQKQGNYGRNFFEFSHVRSWNFHNAVVLHFIAVTEFSDDFRVFDINFDSVDRQKATLWQPVKMT